MLQLSTMSYLSYFVDDAMQTDVLQTQVAYRTVVVRTSSYGIVCFKTIHEFTMSVHDVTNNDSIFIIRAKYAYNVMKHHNGKIKGGNNYAR